MYPDTRRHLGITHLGGGNVDGARRQRQRLCLGDDAFAGSGPASDQYRLAHGPVTKQKRKGHERGNATVQGGRTTQMTLIRHAPALTGGRLCGRTDVAADCSDIARIASVRARLGQPARLITSPALRCRQTAASLWPDLADPAQDARLWEQDFGDWEGSAYGDLPDLGPLQPDDLARHTPPGGESFADLCARVGPALRDLAAAGDAMIVAHAGTVRAALALALGSIPAALAFDVAPLSVTRLSALPGGGWSVACVNWTPA